MALAHLDILRLDRHQVQRRTAFLRAYVGSVRDGEPPGEGWRWAVIADEATCLAELGQLGMLMESDEARADLDLAGRLFLDIGHPYGAYLRAVAGVREPGSMDWFARGAEMLADAHPAEHMTGRGAADAWSVPQQQAYFLLAAAGIDDPPDALANSLFEVAIESPHRGGLAAFGALGVAIQRPWRVAVELLRSTAGRATGAARTVARHLHAMSEQYEAAIERAMVNEYLWSHMAAPVVVLDVEIAGMAAVAHRRLGHDFMVAVEEFAMDGLTPLARVPLEVGMAFGRGDPSGRSAARFGGSPMGGGGSAMRSGTASLEHGGADLPG